MGEDATEYFEQAKQLDLGHYENGQSRLAGYSSRVN